MINVELHVTVLKKRIENITNYVIEKMINDEFENLEGSLTERINIISEIISLQSNDTHKDDLIRYLKEIQNQDKQITQALSERRDQIKKSLLNVNNLKQYVTV